MPDWHRFPKYGLLPDFPAQRIRETFAGMRRASGREPVCRARVEGALNQQDAILRIDKQRTGGFDDGHWQSPNCTRHLLGQQAIQVID